MAAVLSVAGAEHAHASEALRAGHADYARLSFPAQQASSEPLLAEADLLEAASAYSAGLAWAVGRFGSADTPVRPAVVAASAASASLAGPAEHNILAAIRPSAGSKTAAASAVAAALGMLAARVAGSIAGQAASGAADPGAEVAAAAVHKHTVFVVAVASGRRLGLAAGTADSAVSLHWHDFPNRSEGACGGVQRPGERLQHA